MITQDDLILYAFRYALGRKTYVVSDMTQYITKHWDEIDIRVRRQIQHDIEDAFARDEAGMNMDQREWLKIMEL